MMVQGHVHSSGDKVAMELYRAGFAREIEALKSVMLGLNHQMQGIKITGGYTAEELQAFEKRSWSIKLVELESFTKEIKISMASSVVETLDRHTASTQVKVEAIQDDLLKLGATLSVLQRGQAKVA